MTIYQGVVEACRRAGAKPELIARVVQRPPKPAQDLIIPGREEEFIAAYVAIIRAKHPVRMKEIVKLFTNATAGPQN